ncbi:MAG: serine/threonine-protein kinase [Cyanobacteria bacterium J06639_18]
MTICINPSCPQPNCLANRENRFCQSCGSPLEVFGKHRAKRRLNDKTNFTEAYELDVNNDTKVLKLLKQYLSTDSETIELFRQEASVLGQIQHPGIPNHDIYFQYKTRNNLVLHCTVMDKIDGKDLEEWRRQNSKSISQIKAINWLKQLVEILDLSHRKNYLHRDIRPSNIIIKPNQQLTLTNFGTAKELSQPYLKRLSNISTLIEIDSVGYKPPEQMTGETVTQSDFFALGRTFVFLLTGCHPLEMPPNIYDAENDILYWHNETNHISPLFLNLIDDLMAHKVEKRPQNTQEILQRLKQIELQLAPPILPKSYPTSNLPRRKALYYPNTALQNPQTAIQTQTQSKKIPLFSLCAALLVSLGLLTFVANILRSLSPHQTSPNLEHAQPVSVEFPNP